MIEVTYKEVSLEGFEAREIGMAGDLLTAYADKVIPHDFIQPDNIKIGFNMNSGFVFLTNDENQVLMLRNGKLEMFYTCTECGQEGFEDDMVEHNNKFKDHEVL